MNDTTNGLRCEDYAPESPENASFSWCVRYCIHLDGERRFCVRCRTDDNFRRLLQRQMVARFGPDCSDTATYCRIFNLPTNAAQCGQCAADPLYRSFLRGQGHAARLRSDWRRCIHRGERLREEERACCGGSTRSTPVFACALHSEAHEGLCCRCPDATPT